MIYKDITTKKTIISNGQEKTVWLNVGTIRQLDDGKQFIELNIFPNTDFYVFDRKPKDPVIAPTMPVESTLPTQTTEAPHDPARYPTDVRGKELFESALSDEELESLSQIPF